MSRKRMISVRDSTNRILFERNQRTRRTHRGREKWMDNVIFGTNSKINVNCVNF
jgi:hypothetical protein